MAAFKVTGSFTVYIEGTFYADSKAELKEKLEDRWGLVEYTPSGGIEPAYDDLQIVSDDSEDTDWEIEYDEIADMH